MEARQRRWPSEETATIEYDGTTRRVRISDVSETGLKLRMGDPAPARGDPVSILKGGMRATGKIRWIDGTVVGVAFDAPLSADLLALLTGGLYRRDADEDRRGSRGSGRHGARIGFLGTM